DPLAQQCEDRRARRARARGGDGARHPPRARGRRGARSGALRGGAVRGRLARRPPDARRRGRRADRPGSARAGRPRPCPSAPPAQRPRALLARGGGRRALGAAARRERHRDRARMTLSAATALTVAVYLLVADGLAALVLGGRLAGPGAIVAGAAVVGSWWQEPLRRRLDAVPRLGALLVALAALGMALEIVVL